MLGDTLKSLRLKKNKMSQADLAKVMNVSQQTVGSWEVGRAEPNLDTLNKLADFFGVSVGYLTGEKVRDESSEKLDLKDLLRNQAMTYNGEEISEHDLAVLEGVVKAFLEKKGVDTK